MYTIDVRPVSDILPSMFAINFEPHSSYLPADDIVLTLAPESDVKKAFQLFPEYIREGRRGPIHVIEYSENDGEPGLDQTAEGVSARTGDGYRAGAESGGTEERTALITRVREIKKRRAI
jgi:hypothetical protein